MSTPRIHSRQASAGQRQRQRGVYALEWAIIFSAFFMLLYAIVSFGLAFLVRQSMQNAAEDGARAVLRYQTSRPARLDAGRQLVVNRLGWLPPALQPSAASINVRICQAANNQNCDSSLDCGVAVAQRCIVRLDFSIPYGNAPLAPGLSLFGMDILNPERLAASANILADQGGL